MSSHIQRYHDTRDGDLPIDPMTDQSYDQQRMITDESKFKTTLLINETAQSYQSFKPKQIMLGQSELKGIREEINYVKPTDQTKFSEKLYNNLFSQESNRTQVNFKNEPQMVLSQQNIDNLLKRKSVASISSTDQLFQRLSEDSQIIRLKKDKNEIEKESIELKGCTFQPVLGLKTLNIAKVLSKKDLNSPPRYMSPKRNQQRPSNTIDFKKVQPKRIILNEDKENVFDRLNKIQIRVRSPDLNISQVEKYISRQQSPDPVAYSQRLYEDAFRPKKIKIQQQKHPEPMKINKKKQERLQMDYFIKEFFIAIKQSREWTIKNWEEQEKKIDFQFDVENDLCLATIDEMVFVLNQLGFLPLSSYDTQDPYNKAIQMYKLLLCPLDFGLILSRNLLVFLLGVQGISITKTFVPLYINHYGINFPKSYRNELLQFDDGNVRIENVQFIQKRFSGYYLSHLSYYHKTHREGEGKKNVHISEEAKNHNQMTEKLAINYRDRQRSFVNNKEKLELNDFQLIYSQRKDISQLGQREKEIEQCSFRPSINKQSARTSNTLLVRPQNQISNPKSSTQISFERQKDQCTFAPNISRSQSSHQTSHLGDKSYNDKKVKGKVLKKISKIAMINNKNVHIEKLLIQCDTSRSKDQIYEKTQKEPLNQQEPFLFVDVNLDNGESSRIVVCEGDHPQDLAQIFANKHNLDDNLVKKLIQLLNHQIQSVSQK